MATEESMKLMEQAELIISVDDTRDEGDPYKLTSVLRDTTATRLADVRAKGISVTTKEGGRVEASEEKKVALELLGGYLRQGFQHIKAIGTYAITEPERLGLFTMYGWSQGRIGDLDFPRIEELANVAIAVTPTIANAVWQYPQPLMDLITAQLEVLNAVQPLAGTGDRQTATKAHDDAVLLLHRIISRVRHHYCAATDLTDTTPELARIGFQPRRAPTSSGGESPEEPALELPAVPGTATFDSAALTLSIPELPEHATTIRAYRQKTGGEPELAGTSTTTTVSVIGSSPLEGEAEYSVWVVGNNAAGEGPASNVITFIAPV